MLMSAVAIHVKTVVPALMLLIALHATVLLDTLAQTVKQVVFHSRPAFSRIDGLECTYLSNANVPYTTKN